jgi:hypothetical protein
VTPTKPLSQQGLELIRRQFGIPALEPAPEELAPQVREIERFPKALLGRHRAQNLEVPGVVRLRLVDHAARP